MAVWSRHLPPLGYQDQQQSESQARSTALWKGKACHVSPLPGSKCTTGKMLGGPGKRHHTIHGCNPQLPQYYTSVKHVAAR